MSDYWWWAIGGIALIIAELITGTFYLLVLGIAALAGAAVAYAPYSFWTQAVVAAAIAIAGVVWVTPFARPRSPRPAFRSTSGKAWCLTNG